MERLCVSSECAVAHCSLRLLKPACPLDNAWTREPLASQASRTLASLYARTVTSPSQPMRAPTFAYCLPLVEGVLKGSGQAVDGDDVIMRQALEIVTVHACMRAAAESTDFMDEVSASILAVAIARSRYALTGGLFVGVYYTFLITYGVSDYSRGFWD